MAISGTTIGRSSRPSNAACRRKRCRWKASAAAVPAAVESAVAASATDRLLRRADSTWVFSSRRRYQSMVKPRQVAVRRSRLKEKAASTKSGA